MINADMRFYDYFTLGEANAYGQPQMSDKPKGKVKMCINSISTSITDNIRFKDASYIGLTLSLLDDTYIIQYGEEKLKVLYVVPKGRYKQVFLKNI